jgi:hypothetical protein
VIPDDGGRHPVRRRQPSTRRRIHLIHYSPGQISWVSLKIYEPMSAQEKKLGLEVAVLKRTGSSKSQLLGIRESTSLANIPQGFTPLEADQNANLGGASSSLRLRSRPALKICTRLSFDLIPGW